MEYDNDRIIKPPYRIELLAWTVFVLISPLVNCFTIFPNDAIVWPVLLFISMLLLPAYMVYSRLIFSKYLFQRKYGRLIVASIAFFIAAQVLIYGMYSFISGFVLPQPYPYFNYTNNTFIRESIWIIIHMYLAAAIGFIKEALDEKDVIISLQKDNNFFKLRYLRAQLNPHFLFNTLNSIYSLSLQKSDKTPEVVVRLADIMRYLVYECNQERIPLNKEIEFIKNYISIEKLRYNADIQFSVEGDTDQIMIEPFLFISFIENGFKHALDNSFTNPFVYITIKAVDQQIVLNVVNSTSIDLETQAKRISGKSIQNSKTVLELLYPEAYALNIIQTEKKERKESRVRLKNAQERLERFYPDAHTLDVILTNNAFTVSLIINQAPVDKMHHS
jgi:two-component system, LytTR family, sensor kinase